MRLPHLSALSSKRAIRFAEKGDAEEAERSYREAQYFALKSQSDPDADHEYVTHMLEAAQGAILIHLPKSRIARDLRGN